LQIVRTFVFIWNCTQQNTHRKYERQAEGGKALSDAGTGAFSEKFGDVLYIK